jgi:uncharacterized protein (TIGR03067 family)
MPDQGMRLTFAGDTCTITANLIQPRSARWRLDPDRTPKEITLTPKPGVTWPGIYLLEGDSLKLCLNQGGPDRPAKFTGLGGRTFYLYVLEREPADPRGGPEPAGGP